MKLKISAESKLDGEIDLVNFEKIMKNTKLDISRAIEESTIIIKNEFGWPVKYITGMLLAEIDWTAILMNLKWKKAAKMLFKVCPIIFKDKIEYEKYAKSEDYSEIILENIIKTGRGNIVINSFNYDPEHIIDVWIGKSTFPYPKDEWKKGLPVTRERS